MKKFIVLFILIQISFTHIFSQNVKIKTDTLVKLKSFNIWDEMEKPTQYQVDILTNLAIRKTAVKDVGDFLRKLPNVSGIRKGAIGLDPVVRGFKYSQINVQIDNGQKVEGGCPNRMDPTAAHIDIEDVSEIKVIKGPYALRYGPNFGGVIILQREDAIFRDKFGFSLKAIQGFESNWGGMKQHLSLSGGTEDMFFVLTGNYKKYGDYEDGNGNKVNSSFTKYNYSAKLGLRSFKNHKIILAVDESHGENVDFPALPMDERNDDTRLISLDYLIHTIGSKISDVSLKLYSSSVSHEMDNKQRPFSDTVVAVSTIDALNIGYKLNGKISFNKHAIFMGTDYEEIQKNGDRIKTKILEYNMPVFSEKLWNKARIQNYGFFADYKHRVSSIEYIAAIRIDKNHATSKELKLERMGKLLYEDANTKSDFLNISGSAGMTYFLNEKLNLSLSLGRGVRSPDMVERFIILLPIGFDSYDYLGNPQLRPEVNYEVDLSMNYTNMKFGRIYANIFYSYVQDYISGKYVPPSVVKPQSKGVLGVKQFYNIDNVYLSGFEFGFTTPPIWKWGGNISAAYTSGINPEATKLTFDNAGNPIESIVKNDPLPEVPPFEANMSLFYKFYNERLIPKVSIRAVAKQGKPSEAYNETDTPGFLILDAGFSWKMNQNFSLSAGANNILDIAYYEHLNRRIIGSKRNFYEPGRIFYVNLIFTINS
ncbi:TonB-dependent receptor domain-containing protein [Bacteroidota bacterium]